MTEEEFKKSYRETFLSLNSEQLKVVLKIPLYAMYYDVYVLQHPTKRTWSMICSDRGLKERYLNYFKLTEDELTSIIEITDSIL